MLNVETKVRSTLKIMEHTFEALPMRDSGCLIKLNEFVDIKYNVWASVQKILQRAKYAVKHLRIIEKRTIYFARLFARNQGSTGWSDVLEVKTSE